MSTNYDISYRKVISVIYAETKEVLFKQYVKSKAMLFAQKYS